MATFSNQANLPSLPVPKLDDTLDKYLKCARAMASDVQFEKTRQSVEEFRKSTLAAQLQKALENSATEKRNWIDEWWYDAYNEIRDPLAPYVSLAAINSHYPPISGSQLCRAADIAHHWMKFWERIRTEKIMITKSRGVTWDMHQYHCLFNSTRVPALPKDEMHRYFKTEAEGKCPSHIVVLCRGRVWKVEMIADGTVISPDHLYHAFEFIHKNSTLVPESVSTLTTANRDKWAKARTEIIAYSKLNEESMRCIEEAAFSMTLADETIEKEIDLLEGAMMAKHRYFWQDKCINVCVFEDGQATVQGDHSNVDAIAVLHAGDDAAARVRRSIWTPTEANFVHKPEEVVFNLNGKLKTYIKEAENDFENLKHAHRVRVIRYNGYGNEALRKLKIYADTVVQIAMQLSFLKVHGSFAPIYETASTRKFFHGRTETVRGCTEEMVAFGKAVMNKAHVSELQKLFMGAYEAHNKFMAMCMEGMGIDRHLYGLRLTLEQFNKGCSPKHQLPSFMNDDVWKMTGGGGNFLLSTSFTGYMTDNEDGGYGYVCAMRKDGYGTFYRIGMDRILLVATDWRGTKSNVDAYAENLPWAFDQIAALLNHKSQL